MAPPLMQTERAYTNVLVISSMMIANLDGEHCAVSNDRGNRDWERQKEKKRDREICQSFFFFEIGSGAYPLAPGLGGRVAVGSLCASHRRLSFHLRCAVEQLASGTAKWQSSPWLGLALTRIPKSSRWTRWAEPLNSTEADGNTP
jgi:hypothetical protein